MHIYIATLVNFVAGVKGLQIYMINLKSLNFIKCDRICENVQFTQKFKLIFLIQLIATLNSYTHTMSPMARLKWSAFLRGVFGAL